MARVATARPSLAIGAQYSVPRAQSAVPAPHCFPPTAGRLHGHLGGIAAAGHPGAREGVGGGHHQADEHHVPPGAHGPARAHRRVQRQPRSQPRHAGRPQVHPQHGGGDRRQVDGDGAAVCGPRGQVPHAAHVRLRRERGGSRHGRQHAREVGAARPQPPNPPTLTWTLTPTLSAHPHLHPLTHPHQHPHLHPLTHPHPHPRPRPDPTPSPAPGGRSSCSRPRSATGR